LVTNFKITQINKYTFVPLQSSFTLITQRNNDTTTTTHARVSSSGLAEHETNHYRPQNYPTQMLGPHQCRAFTFSKYKYIYLNKKWLVRKNVNEKLKKQTLRILLKDCFIKQLNTNEQHTQSLPKTERRYRDITRYNEAHRLEDSAVAVSTVN